MELDEVEVVGLQCAEAVLDAGADVGGGVDVLAPEASTGNAAALGRQHVLGAAMGDEPSDQLLAPSVVDRRVDEVDPLVEHGIEQPARVPIVELRAAARGPA